jgi:hypothetical protein
MPPTHKKTIIPESPKTAPLAGLAPNSVLRLRPNRALWKAQDTQTCSYRTLCEYAGLDGAGTWNVPAGTTDPTMTVAQEYPNADVWRTVAINHARLTPGCVLSMHCIYCPAGLTQKIVDPVPEWQSAGAWAQLRAVITWTSSDCTTSVETTHTLAIEGSNKGDWGGAENTEAGSDWFDLREKMINRMLPPGYDSDPAIGVTYSEWTDVKITLQVRGGERIVHAIVHEVPFAHYQEWDETGPQTVFGDVNGWPDKPRRPKTGPPRGA